MSDAVVVLAGGTGGAKLARGMLDVVGESSLTVIANTGDDIEIHGAYVSPDPDLVSFWLADSIDERGWGLAGDTFAVMDGLRSLGEEVWFNLGDRDLALGLVRARELRAGRRLTEVHDGLARALGARGRILPMSDHPVRTRVMADDRWWSLQEYLIRARTEEGWPAVRDVQFHGAAVASPTPQVLQAIAQARAVIIGPSNPVISIGPILALPGLREALIAAETPVVAVSPLVGGEALKGPTVDFLSWRGAEASVQGIAEMYADLAGGLVADGACEVMPVLVTDVLMDGPAGRERLARETLEFALALPRRSPDQWLSG